MVLCSWGTMANSWPPMLTTCRHTSAQRQHTSADMQGQRRWASRRGVQAGGGPMRSLVAQGLTPVRPSSPPPCYPASPAPPPVHGLYDQAVQRRRRAAAVAHDTEYTRPPPRDSADTRRTLQAPRSAARPPPSLTFSILSMSNERPSPRVAQNKTGSQNHWAEWRGGRETAPRPAWRGRSAWRPSSAACSWASCSRSPPPAGGCRATPSRRPQQRERACSPCTDPAAVPMRRRCASVRCSTVPPSSIVLGFSH
jgi:hypothetical protein